ncbi:MAG: hypothetical protein AMJ91_02045 [candidate division Zixibacteria bacterium SM23_73_3]|nr:MAG: hypothetical protein AMJ91_02045 [candidate division Zixibacteria bacterium SM23_73_3]
MADLGQILIAEDEETFLNSTADLLRRSGYRCACVPDAVTAAEKLRRAEYDLLIADIKMPGNPELEFIQDVPQIAEGMPVILVTGYPSLTTAIQSIQLPVVAYLVKPIDFDELLALAKRSIKNFRVYRAVRSIDQRLQNWLGDLAGTEEVLKSAPGYTSSAPVDAFLKLTYRNVVGALSDMKHLTEALALQAGEQEACHLLNCPKLTTLTNALKETIDVLEETKTAFKSKKLGELRGKLESLLKEK